MTPALIMLGYVAALAWLGPAPLARLTAAGINARLGLAVWFVAMSSALASAVVAVSFLVRTAVNGWPRFAGTICQSVTGGPCPPQLYRSAIFEASVAAASALAVLTVITLAWRYGRSVHDDRRRASEHAQAARITGRRFPGTGIPPLSTAVVLETPQPAVYCVPGRPATIVLTTGALAVLDQPQLLAVLAHERAHLAGRHHLLVTLGKAARAGFPGVPLFTRGADEVARLAEMRADDVAARRRGRDTLLQALVAMGTGRALTAPSASLAATGGAVTVRVRRLLDPPSGTSRACHGLGLAGVLLALAAVSVLLPVLS
jgi:beta-lactamase regulating signal transducer with metallopeptidase domain